MISYVLALLAAVVNAIGNVLNRKAAREEPAQERFRLQLILGLLHRPVWLAAVGLMTLSFVFSSAALGTGQLASVQLIIVLELPITLIVGSWALGRRLGMREWVAMAALTAGMIGLLAILDPRPGPARAVAPLLWILASAANGGAILVFFLMARVRTSGASQAAFLGIAAGFGYGLTAAFTKGMADQFNAGGLAKIVASWQLYACVAAGIVSTWLLQNAYHAGTLAAAQPGITLVDPFVATCWGALVFGERVAEGPILWLTALPLLALAAGALVLSRSPILQTAQATADQRGTANPGHGAAAACRYAEGQPAPGAGQC